MNAASSLCIVRKSFIFTPPPDYTRRHALCGGLRALVESRRDFDLAVTLRRAGSRGNVQHMAMFTICKRGTDGCQTTERATTTAAAGRESVTGARRGQNERGSSKIAATDHRQHDGRGGTADRPGRVDIRHLLQPQAGRVAIHPLRRPLCHTEDGPRARPDRLGRRSHPARPLVPDVVEGLPQKLQPADHSVGEIR